MPDIFPFLAPRPAPANTSALPSAPPERGTDPAPQRRDEPKEFAEKVDALDRRSPPREHDDSPPKEPPQAEPAPDQEPAPEDPMFTASEPAVLAPFEDEARTKFAADLLLGRQSDVVIPKAQHMPGAIKPANLTEISTANLPKTAQTGPAKPDAGIILPVAGDLARGAVEGATNLAQAPQDLAKTAASTATVLQGAVPTQRAVVPTGTGTNLTDLNIASEGEHAPALEFEPELPLPERKGLNNATTAATAAAQRALQANAQLVQNISAHAAPMSEDITPQIDEVMAALGQTSSATPISGVTAPGAAPVQIAQQAASQIVAGLPRDQGVIVTPSGTEIQLDPPELGRVRMIVTEVAGGLALTVTTERQETLDLFKRYAAMLAQEFANEGFADTNFSFHGEGHSEEEGPSEGLAVEQTDKPEGLVASALPRLAQSSGLDLRL